MRVNRIGGGQVFPDDGPRGARLIRRIRGISLEILAFVLVTALLPVLLVGAALVDLALWLRRRKPWVGVRLVAFLWWFLLGEMRTLLVILGIWIRNGGPFRGDSIYRQVALYNLRMSWARWHLAGIRVTFGLRFEVEDLDSAGPGPIVLFIRHASIVDNLLPDTLVAHAHGLGLRYVIKRELQSIPVIDIGGRWVPTNFVRRGSGDSATEVERLRLLAEDMHPGEGILVYPEGTRFTKAKLARAKEKIAEGQPEIASRAERLQNLLPPRLGGPLAVLEDTVGTDVVFCAHVGFDGFATIGDIWRGKLVGRTIAVRFWRVPAAEIPTDREGRIDWLYEHWQELDDWVGARRGADTAAPGQESA
jgi:1-acyl-sn-glycerol-3-phosphate acyltransferase